MESGCVLGPSNDNVGYSQVQFDTTSRSDNNDKQDSEVVAFGTIIKTYYFYANLLLSHNFSWILIVSILQGYWTGLQDVISQSHFTFNPINIGSYWQTQTVGNFCSFILFICRFDGTFLVWALQVMFYEALKDLTEYGKQRWIPSLNSYVNISIEGLVLGGLAGGMRLASLLSWVKPIWIVCDLIQISTLLDTG